MITHTITFDWNIPSHLLHDNAPDAFVTVRYERVENTFQIRSCTFPPLILNQVICNTRLLRELLDVVEEKVRRDWHDERVEDHSYVDVDGQLYLNPTQ